MKRKKNKRALVRAVVTLIACTAYMSQVLIYLAIREDMKYVQERAYYEGWTDELVSGYNAMQEAIKTSQNLIVYSIYHYHTQMVLLTICVMVLMIVEAMRIIDYAERRKKHRAARAKRERHRA